MLSRYQGFSLAEVLVALFLVTSTCLGLLTQQSHIAILLNQVSRHSRSIIQLDNQAETGFKTSSKALGLRWGAYQ